MTVARQRNRREEIDQPGDGAGCNPKNDVFYDPLRLLHLVHCHEPPAAFWRAE